MPSAVAHERENDVTTDSAAPCPIEVFFVACEEARRGGSQIQRVSASDKEYHFQNWVRARLEEADLAFDEPSRNAYPDFRLVETPIGIEVKGLAYPGRKANYDSNSQVPTGTHRGRTVYYAFGRYPSGVSGESQYPVVDLIVCHGDFLNADHGYVHKNDSFRGFGSYGDIMIRDRKMYVAPTPYALTDGTAALGTLIVPAGFEVTSSELVKVGTLTRVEADEVVVAYEFDLKTSKLLTAKKPNPTRGTEHTFDAYRLKGAGEERAVTMIAPKI